MGKEDAAVEEDMGTAGGEKLDAMMREGLSL